MPDTHTGPAEPPPEITEQVRELLAATGIHPHADEIEIIAAMYPGIRAAADRLYDLVYDDDPAPVFDPVALFRAGRDG